MCVCGEHMYVSMHTIHAGTRGRHSQSSSVLLKFEICAVAMLKHAWALVLCVYGGSVELVHVGFHGLS